MTSDLQIGTTRVRNGRVWRLYEIELEGEKWEDIGPAPLTPPAEQPAPDVRRFRHKTRGTTYTLLGHGKAQCSPSGLLDDENVVIYRGDDGSLWARRYAEFWDGRFEEIEGQPAPDVREGVYNAIVGWQLDHGLLVADEAGESAHKLTDAILALIEMERAKVPYQELSDLHTIKGWLHGLASAPDLNDVVADGGITSGMVYQQEATNFAGCVGRILAALSDGGE